MFSQSENKNTFQCVRTTFGHQRLPFSTKQDMANGWKRLFLETKKTTQQWALTRSLFANIAFSSNSNSSFVCVRYSIREIFYSSKCTYLPCWGSYVRIIMVSDDAEFKKLSSFVNLTGLTYNRVIEYSAKWVYKDVNIFFQINILYKIHPVQNWSAGSQLSSRRGICQMFYASKILNCLDFIREKT